MSAEQKKLEQFAAKIGRAIGENVDGIFGRRRVGYAMLLFDFGDSGNMAYASNGNRDDMIKALLELVGHLKGS